MITEVRPLQHSNALRPIVVTELGMVTEVKKEHFLKASLMEVTE